MGKLYIIGVSAGIELPNDVEVVIAKEEFLQFISDFSGEKVVMPAVSEVSSVIKEMLEKGKNIAVCVSGDPLFYSLGEKLVQEFTEAEVIPNVSYMQLAFSKIKKSWKDANFVSVHGRDILSILPALVRSKGFLFVFTGGKNTPDVLAKFLLEQEVTDINLWVFERLGFFDECWYSFALEEAAHLKFREPNCVILEKKKLYPCVFEDKFYKTKKGLLTKSLVRSAILSFVRADYRTVWDIGAGTGAVGITLSQYTDIVYAVEREEQHFELLKENRKIFGAWNVLPILGDACELLSELPVPDFIFVGAPACNVLEDCWGALRRGGRLVATAVSKSGISTLLKFAGEKQATLYNFSVTIYGDKLPEQRVPIWLMVAEKYM